MARAVAAEYEDLHSRRGGDRRYGVAGDGPRVEYPRGYAVGVFEVI